MKSVVHLLSGGLDSVTLLYDLRQHGNQIHCLLFDYHQQHSKELIQAKYHANRCGAAYSTVTLPLLGGLNDKSWIVPNRNAIFLSVAVNLAVQISADSITIGCNKEDSDYFPDCRKEFIDSMNQSVVSAGYSVKIVAPYLNKMKWEIGGMAREFKIHASSVWSCYRGGHEPCGECPACIKLKSACA